MEQKRGDKEPCVEAAPTYKAYPCGQGYAGSSGRPLGVEKPFLS